MNIDTITILLTLNITSKKQYSQLYCKIPNCHTPSGVRPDGNPHAIKGLHISIHAPQYEVRLDHLLIFKFAFFISIHAPQYEVRLFQVFNRLISLYFNPRTPIRGATFTHFRICQRCSRNYFNPRTPIRGATEMVTSIGTILKISIHAPQYEVRPILCCFEISSNLFQSTHPNTRCDLKVTHVKLEQCNFNPRTPIRGATSSTTFCGSVQLFQSTHPNTRCDPFVSDWSLMIAISIHAPQYEVRPSGTRTDFSTFDFNPRTPIRGATCQALDFTILLN